MAGSRPCPAWKSWGESGWVCNKHPGTVGSSGPCAGREAEPRVGGRRIRDRHARGTRPLPRCSENLRPACGTKSGPQGSSFQTWDGSAQILSDALLHQAVNHCVFLALSEPMTHYDYLCKRFQDPLCSRQFIPRFCSGFLVLCWIGPRGSRNGSKCG